MCLRVVEDDRKVGAIGLCGNIVLRDETIANFLQALAEDKTSASFWKTFDTIAFFERVPAERQQRKILSDVRQA